MDISLYLAKNIRQLRKARGLTQQKLAGLCGIPRPTWANLESGAANPTLTVLARVAAALQVPIEELIGPPRSDAKLYRAGTLPVRRRGDAVLRALLPEKIPTLEVDRLELQPGARMAGVPHTPGTREYLTCESGLLELVASGQSWRLEPGDVVVFRGDQPHSYRNPGARRSSALSVVALAPPG
jgi:XRE family transcriptional regulator, regulator of sulfur utilization